MATREELEAREDVKAILDGLRSNPKLAHKRLRPIDSTIGVIIVQNPSKGQWNVTRTQIWDDDKGVASKAMEGLLRGCIVYPEPAVLNAALEDMAGALDEPELMKEFRRHIGHLREAETK